MHNNFSTCDTDLCNSKDLLQRGCQLLCVMLNSFVLVVSNLWLQVGTGFPYICAWMVYKSWWGGFYDSKWYCFVNSFFIRVVTSFSCQVMITTMSFPPLCLASCISRYLSSDKSRLQTEDGSLIARSDYVLDASDFRFVTSVSWGSSFPLLALCLETLIIVNIERIVMANN